MYHMILVGYVYFGTSKFSFPVARRTPETFRYTSWRYQRAVRAFHIADDGSHGSLALLLQRNRLVFLVF